MSIKIERKERKEPFPFTIKGDCDIHGENVYFVLVSEKGNYNCGFCEGAERPTPPWKMEPKISRRP